MMISELMGVRLGVDIGGTLTKFLVLDNGEKVYMESFPTPTESPEALLDFIADKYTDLSRSFKIERVGIGTPGIVKNGSVHAENLPLHNIPVCELLRKRIDKPVTLDNDANCATLAEAKLYNIEYKNLVMITIGTGVGGGIVLDEKIRRGKGGMGEIGHMVVEATNGLPCPCGNNGCWEQYASTTALVKKAEQAAINNKDSYLYNLYCLNNKLNGKLLFDAIRKECSISIKVLSEYLDILAIGIKSLVYVLDPDVIVLAGGITKDGDLFIDELRKRVNMDVKLEISTLQNEAGAYGAAML